MLCDKHFYSDSFTKPTKERLKTDAVPMKYAEITEIRSSSPAVLKVQTPTKTYLPKVLIEDSPLLNRPSTSKGGIDLSLTDVSPGTQRWLVSISDLPEDVGEKTRRAERAKRKLALADEDTPRKKRLKAIVASQKTNLKNKQSQISKMKKKIRNQYTKLRCVSADLMTHRLKFLKPQAQTFIKMNLVHNNKSPWTKREKDFALSLYYKSPATYRYLRSLGFQLPGVSSIRRWIGSSKFKTGFSQLLFLQIKNKAASMNEIEKICVLCTDEMSIMSIPEYSKAMDFIEGYEDLGATLGRKNKKGKKCMVFMIRGLHSKWKLPIAYFIAHSGVTADDLKNLLMEAVKKVRETGLTVKAMICDQGTSNVSALKGLGVTSEKPYFLVDHEKVYCIYDVPHLMKSIRNNLLNGDFILDDKKISFKDIRDTYAIDRKSGGARALCKITDSHLNPNAFQKMSCKLALQVLSHSMAATIKTCIATNQLQSDSAASTADFLESMDKTFDCLNSRSRYSCNPYNCSLSPNNKLVEDTLRQSIDIMQKVRKIDFKGKISRPPCFEGMIVSIKAILLLYEEQSNNGFEYLLTSRLNQDVLENFFSSIRQRGGFNRNPSVRMFRTSFRMITLAHLMKPPESANCEVDDDIMLNFEESSTSSGITGSNLLSLECPSEESDQQSSSSSQLSTASKTSKKEVNLEDCATAYFAGYLIKKCLDKFNCEQCRRFLIKKSVTLNDKKQLLIVQKTYDNKQASSEGLRSPTDFMIDLVDNAVAIVSKCLRLKPQRYKIGQNMYNKIVKKINRRFQDFDVHHEHCGPHRQYMLHLLVRSKIFKWCKWESILANTSVNTDGKPHAKLRILKNQ